MGSHVLSESYEVERAGATGIEGADWLIILLTNSAPICASITGSPSGQCTRGSFLTNEFSSSESIASTFGIALLPLPASLALGEPDVHLPLLWLTPLVPEMERIDLCAVQLVLLA